MTAEQQMLFPFTNKDEILYWADRYTKRQSDKRRCQEEDVRKIRENVEARQDPRDPRRLSHGMRIAENGRLERPICAQ